MLYWLFEIFYIMIDMTEWGENWTRSVIIAFTFHFGAKPLVHFALTFSSKIRFWGWAAINAMLQGQCDGNVAMPGQGLPAQRSKDLGPKPKLKTMEADPKSIGFRP